MIKEKNSSKKTQRLILRGQSISSGISQGKAFHYKDILTRDLLSYSIKKHEIRNELQRIKEAVLIVLQDIEIMKKNVETYLNKEHSAIFDVHKEILKDEVLANDFEEEIRRELVNAEHVVRNVMRKWSAKFKSSRSDIVKSHVDDIEDINRRLLRVLLGFEKNVLEKLPLDSIIFAERLLPSDTVHLKRENVKGIIVRHGTKYSHSAILARAIGIPAVANPDSEFECIHDGDGILIDGNEGVIIVHPDKKDLIHYRKKRREEKKLALDLIRKSSCPLITQKGDKIFVYANASTPEEVEVALKNGCDGIGLFRIEHIYLSSKFLPDETMLMKYMEDVLKFSDGKEVIIRLLDVGGDKRIPNVQVEDELSHFLGLRGIRLLLAHENLLRKQIRAVLCLARNYHVRLLVPMVTLPEEMQKVKEVLRSCRRELESKANSVYPELKVGAMIETPAAVMNVDEVAQCADFLSIGTNDLIQYTMAAGREDKHVTDYYEKGAHLVLKSIKNVVQSAEISGIECSVCGEIAGDTQWTEQILHAGVRNFSVSPYRIPEIKEAIKKVIDKKIKNF
ncbi:MAG: phosphoenolpyruvate--protein phosphotransferase [Candidatus Aureabacteria bacterium]|nr:phosphoenolpyruvate--protein phosphotransferase [Candidatus Auribacterota bacterium]